MADELGQFLRELRHKRGLTVRDLAEALEKSPGYISKVEARGEIPTGEFLCQLADFYGVKPETLFLLAKNEHLSRVTNDIDKKHQQALVLYRKSKQ